MFLACEKLGLDHDDKYKFFTEDGCELTDMTELSNEEITKGQFVVIAKTFEPLTVQPVKQPIDTPTDAAHPVIEPKLTPPHGRLKHGKKIVHCTHRVL